MPRKAAKKPTNASEARRTNMLLEKLLAEFKTFGEGLADLRARVARLEPVVNQLVAEFQTFKIALQEVAKDVAELKKDVKDVKERLTIVETKSP